jgi:hypothetical protein
MTMNTAFKFITLAFVALSSAAFAAPPADESIMVIGSKHKNLFVFRAGKSLKGAEISVYSATGDVVARQKLSSKKMVIDFSNVKFGIYTIGVKKDGIVQEFNYEKKLVLSQVTR